MELGLYSFAENTPDVLNGGHLQSPAERLRDLLEEIELADQLGLDFYGLGEHHRPDYVASAPVTILAAAAARTRSIRLTTAVTVLSSEDPVRVWQQFATLDLISNGRAEIMAGRGSFIESFPLFGLDLNDYDDLFAEKLAMLMALRKSDVLDWPGSQHTPRIPARGVYPRPERELPLWIAVGGTPQSAARAGALGLPMAFAIIGGEPARFEPYFRIYREQAHNAGHDPAKLPTSINVHGFVAASDDDIDMFYRAESDVMARIGKERGFAPPSRAQFDAGVAPRGHLFVGEPQRVVDKILANHEVFGFDRFLLQMAIGVIPHDRMMKAIELYGTRVAPEVRKAVGKPLAERQTETILAQ